MAQSDQVVQNDTFPAFRADLNNNLAALFSDNSGTVAPTPTVAFMDWIDTSGANPVWRKRNAANNAWVTVGTIIGNTLTLAGSTDAVNAVNLTGTSTVNIQTAALATGTANSTTFLRGDRTWQAVVTAPVSQTFTSSGTWTKPAGCVLVYVELWGGGGGGARGTSVGGGGGGAFRFGFIPASELNATESATVGAGGTGRTGSNGNGTNGGGSTFSSLFAGGGGLGFTTSPGGGSGGGWRTSATGMTRGEGYLELGRGSDNTADVTLWVGTRGGAFDTTATGSTVYGGGGGGGRDSNTVRPGTTSVYGGSGGAGGGAGAGQPGGVRGGGGGSGPGDGGNGGRGEIRVYSW